MYQSPLHRSCRILAAVLACAATSCSGSSIAAPNPPFSVSSTTFTNNSALPQAMIYNGTGGSVCTGGDQSPQLSWANAPAGTKTFAVVVFDVTANFTHWGIYNIAPTVTSLPVNAGVAASTFGSEVANVFGKDEYDGPCPPPGAAHTYVTTVYAVDSQVNLSPGAAGTDLINALNGHTLGSANLTGTYGT